MSKTFSKSDTKKKEKIEKVKFTTMLSKQVREQLGIIAKNKQMSIGNVIDTMVKEYFA